ncbi:MAG: aminopeptidase [Clostridia bacterium]|nr:aminopeptidase [Clostridia bacterium]
MICASRPLCLNGTLVKDIRFTVENGKIVKEEASEGLETLKKALEIDDGARYFGELALVEYDSPISKQGIVYYNTLFDENAACHIAFGNAYPDCVRGAENFSSEEYEKAGLNASFAHEDFMIGTADLSIVGTTKDGTEVVIFRNGNFAL